MLIQLSAFLPGNCPKTTVSILIPRKKLATWHSSSWHQPTTSVSAPPCVQLWEKGLCEISFNKRRWRQNYCYQYFTNEYLIKYWYPHTLFCPSSFMDNHWGVVLSLGGTQGGPCITTWLTDDKHNIISTISLIVIFLTAQMLSIYSYPSMFCLFVCFSDNSAFISQNHNKVKHMMFTEYT